MQWDVINDWLFLISFIFNNLSQQISYHSFFILLSLLNFFLFLLLKLYLPHLPLLYTEKLCLWSWKLFVTLFFILVVVSVTVWCVNSREWVWVNVCLVCDNQVCTSTKLRAITEVISMDNCPRRLVQVKSIIVCQRKDKRTWSLISGLLPILKSLPWNWSIPTDNFTELCLYIPTYLFHWIGSGGNAG